MYLIDHSEYCSLSMVIFFFLKSNLDNALHLGNYNGDVSLLQAYLLVYFFYITSLFLLCL